MTKWALAGAVALLVAGPAFAASPGSGPYQWSGLYVGAQTGYAMVDSAEYYKDGIPSDLHQHIGAEGATGGLFLGYNHIFSGSFLGGIEVEGNLHDLIGLHGTEAYGPYYRHDWSTAARLRFGFFPTADTLLYLSAGAEVGNFDYDEGELRFGGDSNMNQTLTGLQLGLGVETFVSRNVSVRAEAMYTHYDASAWMEPSKHGFYAIRAQPDVLATRIGVTYHPGWLGGDQAPVARDIPDASWNGFYAGGQVGMTLLASIEDNDPAYYTQYGPYYALTAHDGSVGGHAGFNRQFGIWVAGLEADAALQMAKIIYGDHFYAKQPWSASVRARLGVLARPNVLLYATAGIAASHFEYSEAVFNPSIGYEGQIFNDTGLQVGGGVEAFFSRHLSMRVEGLYTRYEVHKITEDGDPNWIIEPHTLEARAGLSYHFN